MRLSSGYSCSYHSSGAPNERQPHALFCHTKGIETFFSDQKSRGFYLGHSHIRDTAHLERLLIGTCLAYLWMVCLGAWVVQTGKLTLIHRADRCDWSLFRIGMAWIEFCL